MWRAPRPTVRFPGTQGPLSGDCKFVAGYRRTRTGAVCEVEIDPDTGAIEIKNYSCVDGVGRVESANRRRVHGGISRAPGQALMEHVIYQDDGQILRSFMDYCMRGRRLPSFNVETNEVISKGNPLGVKGGGEAGTTGALAAMMNAVLHALGPLGITRLDMPATPHRVWQAIHRRS
jgi:carbon-monoxide dehydrogenase large subunit